MKFYNYINESIKKIPFISNPKLGWWLDKDPVMMFHGTHISNLDDIDKNGILSPGEGYTTGKVSLTFDPYTAFGYAAMSAMGGESRFFRSGTSKVKNTPPEERAIIIVKIPQKILLKWVKQTGYKGSKTFGWDKRMFDKKSYERFNGTDTEFYQMSELKAPGKVDRKYIKGYMVKK